MLAIWRWCRQTAFSSCRLHSEDEAIKAIFKLADTPTYRVTTLYRPVATEAFDIQSR